MNRIGKTTLRLWRRVERRLMRIALGLCVRCGHEPADHEHYERSSTVRGYCSAPGCGCLRWRRFR